MKKETYLLSFFIALAILIAMVNIYFAPDFQKKETDASGFGISPPYVQSESLVAGEGFSQRIRVLRGDTGRKQKVVARVDSQELLDWISFKPEELFFAEGERTLWVTVNVKSPVNALNGEHQGYVYFAILPAEGNTSGVGINLGARADIDINIIDGREIGDDTITEKVIQLNNDTMVDKLRGRFLIRPYSKGEIYYIHPNLDIAYYLVDENDFRPLLDEVARGIDDNLLMKIPLDETHFFGIDTDEDGLPDDIEMSIGTEIENPDTDGDGFGDYEEIMSEFSPFQVDEVFETDKILAENLAGELLLQVENKGQLWYIDPSSAKRIMISDVSNFIDIVKTFALGISEDNFGKIVK